MKKEKIKEMKNILVKIASLTIVLLLLVGFNSCVKDEFDTPPVQDIPVGDVYSVADLLAAATSAPQKVTEDKSIYGVITMGEQNGNLYKEAYMSDATGGVKLSLLSSTSLTPGDSIRVYLNGARFYNDNDQITIDSLETTYNIIKISAGNAVSPIDVTIADINTGAYIGQLVKLSGVQFKNSELGKTYADAQALVTTNRTLEDCNAETIVRTSGYSNFAGVLLPEGNGSLICVASSYRGTSQLYIRDVNEVLLSGERCGDNPGGGPVDPVDAIDEKFDDVVDYTDVSISGWTNLIVAGDRFWQGKTFNNGADKYIQASGYNSGLAEMETWLITPPVTNISEKVLSLKSGIAYWEHTNGVPLTVLISTDFVGDNFATATWTELNVNLASQNSSDYAWVESGEVDLSNFSGNAAIAFKYVGSDTESTSSLIDDVVIDIPGGGGGGTGVDPVDEVDEDFGSQGDYDDINLVGWTNMKVEGDRAWIARVYDDNPYAQSSGYNSGLSVMESWLITPPVTNIQDKKISFISAMAYWEHGSNIPLTVLVSEDYDGENFETASWTEINVNLATQSDGDHTWVESGEYDLSAFNGNAAIAFKYVGSDSESTTFRIDDVLITDGSGGGGGGGGTVDMIDEQFNSIVDYEDFAEEGWVNVNIEGDRKWQGKVYEQDKYVQSTGYNSGVSYMECWLITPVITDIGSKSLSLTTAMAYWAHGSDKPLTIYVSEDYDGENYGTATWTEINVTTAGESSGDHTWVDSGSYDLSNFDGNAAIAFKYVGSDTESTSIRLDNILVQ